MIFQADAITTNIATVVAMRNHNLSVSSGRPACWAASVEVSGARTTNARASPTTAKAARRKLMPAGRGVLGGGRPAGRGRGRPAASSCQPAEESSGADDQHHHKHHERDRVGIAGPKPGCTL